MQISVRGSARGEPLNLLQTVQVFVAHLQTTFKVDIVYQEASLIGTSLVKESNPE